MNNKQQIARWMTDNLQSFITPAKEINRDLMAEDAAAAFGIDVGDDKKMDELIELAFDVTHEEGYV